MAHSYCRFCMPTTEFSPTDVGTGKIFLTDTYRINNSGISAEACATFDLGGGRALRFILVTLRGMDNRVR